LLPGGLAVSIPSGGDSTRKMPKRNLIWIIAIAGAAIVMVWITRRPAPRPDPSAVQFAPVIGAYHQIQQHYYRDVSDEQLRRAAVRGMVESLDEFSSYVEPDRQEQLDRRLMGRRVGLGLRIESKDGQVRVVGAFPGSPAHHAGIRRGDRIIAIDGVELVGLALHQVRQLLENRSADHVELTIQAPGQEARKVTLSREAFPIETVQGLCRDRQDRWVWSIGTKPRVAYVRISEFVPDTAEQLQRVLRSVGTPDGLIMDLRDNPGGLLASAVQVADMFISDRPIVTVLSKHDRPQEYRASSEATIYQGVPIVVLIDARTASAAEIVAGALKRANRAVLIGTRTRGKGCVQTPLRLPGRLGQVNLTTAEYVLPGGRKISRLPGSDVWGVDPHVQVIILPHVQRRLEQLRWRNEVLAGRDVASQGRSTFGPCRDVLQLDAQLAQALRLLSKPRLMDEILNSSFPGPQGQGAADE